MIIDSIYVFKKYVKTYNKTLNTQNTQSSNQWQLSDQLYMGGFQFIPKHGHALVTRRNRTVLRDREKVSVDHKRQWLVCFGLRKKMFHVNGLLNMIWPLFNRMGVKGKMISLYNMFVFIVSWQFVYNASCTFHGFLFSDFYTYR